MGYGPILGSCYGSSRQKGHPHLNGRRKNFLTHICAQHHQRPVGAGCIEELSTRSGLAREAAMAYVCNLSQATQLGSGEVGLNLGLADSPQMSQSLPEEHGLPSVPAPPRGKVHGDTWVPRVASQGPAKAGTGRGLPYSPALTRPQALIGSGQQMVPEGHSRSLPPHCNASRSCPLPSPGPRVLSRSLV